MTEDTTTGPITTLDIREGFYATDSHGFVQVRRGLNDALFVWELSCLGPGGEPSTWEYRTYGQSLDYIRQYFPASRWWPCVDVRPEALADLVRRLAAAEVDRDVSIRERDEARAEAEASAALLRAEQDCVQDLRAELRDALRDRDAARQALTDAGMTAEREAVRAERDRLRAELSALRAYMIRSLESGLTMDEGVELLDAIGQQNMAIVDRWAEAMSAEYQQARSERDAAVRDRDIARMHLAEIAQILALDPVTTVSADVIAAVREMRAAAMNACGRLALAGVVADLAGAQQVRAALDAAPPGAPRVTIDTRAVSGADSKRDASARDLDRAHREIRRLLAERAAAVMERDRARADLDARLVDHLRTDAEHRAEIERLREQVARLVEGA